MELSDLEVMSYQIDEWQGVINVTLDRVRQLEGRDLWAIREAGFVLDRNGEWEYEPLPSSRDEDFLVRCRFDTPEEAVGLWKRERRQSQYEHYRTRAQAK